MRLPFKSLRWSLQLWHALILLVVITALCLLAFRIVTEERMQSMRRELKDFDRTLLRLIVFDGNEEEIRMPLDDEEIHKRLMDLASMPGAPPEITGALGVVDEYDPYFAVWDKDGKPLFVSKNAPQDIGEMRPELAAREAALPGESRILEIGSHLLFPHQTPFGFLTLSGVDISREQTNFQRLGLLLSASGTGLWLLGLAGGWWLAGRAIKPIGAITETAARIANGDLSDRVKPPGTDDELAALSEVLNGTFDQLESMIRQQKQFIADASHELRTPVAVILNETHRGLKMKREPEEYNEILNTCRRMSERMRELLGSLLALARQDSAEMSQREKCELGSIVRNSCKELRGMAMDGGNALTVTVDEVDFYGDRQALEMIVMNLISNAIHHTPDGSMIDVRLTAGEEIALSVRDDGPGIDPKHVPHLFERFYRTDAARGADGHSGLGLAIVKAAVENHGGRVEVVSGVEKGTVFTVYLPGGK
ncbi:ATP-binding protein [Luteolibacter sp. AS25]|uniref:HAMP domain-containing sensor histidine kinase n=1 Tax=Luteolibacter sp. AS25 TaxID=3135776 RepID=UPI00398B0F82